MVISLQCDGALERSENAHVRNAGANERNDCSNIETGSALLWRVSTVRKCASHFSRNGHNRPENKYLAETLRSALRRTYVCIGLTTLRLESIGHLDLR